MLWPPEPKDTFLKMRSRRTWSEPSGRLLLTERERELLQLLAEGKSDKLAEGKSDKLLSEQDIQASIEMALSAHQSHLDQRAVPTIVEGIKQRRNALDLALHVLESVNWGMVTGKRRGRPKGSKNKPKLTAASLDG